MALETIGHQQRNKYGFLRAFAIAGALSVTLGACEATQQVGQTVGKWSEDATGWASQQIKPASADPAQVVYKKIGTASWYGNKHHGRKTASGERFDMNAMTAAHRTLPFGTKVKVTNLSNGRSIIVTINDRGPRYKKRMIDLSKRAAARLGFMRKGSARVRVETMPSKS